MLEFNNNFVFPLHSFIDTAILNIHCFGFPLVYNELSVKMYWFLYVCFRLLCIFLYQVVLWDITAMIANRNVRRRAMKGNVILTPDFVYMVVNTGTISIAHSVRKCLFVICYELENAVRYLHSKSISSTLSFFPSSKYSSISHHLSTCLWLRQYIFFFFLGGGGLFLPVIPGLLSKTWIHYSIMQVSASSDFIGSYLFWGLI